MDNQVLLEAAEYSPLAASCVRTDNVGDSNGDAKSALLIFDWDGNLKYRLLISEDLATYGTVFDPVHKKMYCCTEDDDTLYCYDLSGYL